MRINTYLLFICIGLLSSSCSISKRVQQHQNLLQSALKSEMSPPEKFDVLAESLVGMMHHSLDFANPKKGVKFIEAYGNTNKVFVDQLFQEFSAYEKNLSTVERIAFGATLVSKPYFRDLINLVPRFRRKYEQIKFVTDVTKQLKGSAMDWLGSKIPG